MGSTAKTLPTRSLRALARPAVVGHLGLLVHGLADGVADVLAHDEKPAASATVCTAWPMSPMWLPATICGDAGVQRRPRSRR